MFRKINLAVFLGGLILLIALANFVVHRHLPPPVVVTLIGLSNSTSGMVLAQFRVANQSSIQIARNGYCRLDGNVVDIPPTRTLTAGTSEIVSVPLPSHYNDPMTEIRFNGVRDFHPMESIIDRIKDWLKAAGLDLAVLDLSERRRWDAGVTFRREAISHGGDPR